MSKATGNGAKEHPSTKTQIKTLWGIKLRRRRAAVSVEKDRESGFEMDAEPHDTCQNNSHNEGACIITVGSTGTGKSRTIKTYTLQDVTVSTGAESETRKCSLYTNNRDPELHGWIDTVGWNDTRGQDDQLSFQELLQFINNNDITKVKAVIWTVVPNLKKDAQLQKQADFINQICPGQVWENVIIIARAGRNPKDDCQGALTAAREKGKYDNITCLSYTYYNESENMHVGEVFRNNPELRTMLHMLTENEVYLLLKEKLDTITEPVQVIFNNKRCLNCGVVGDERLLPKYCHLLKVTVHNGELEIYHPGVEATYHPLSQHEIHTGNVKIVGGDDPGWAMADDIIRWIPVANIITVLGKCFSRKEVEIRFQCCDQLYGKPGCHTVWKCCNKEVSDPGCQERYTCCARPLVTNGCERKYKCCNKKEGTEGCIARCVYCGGLWGTATNNCFVTSHKLILLP